MGKTRPLAAALGGSSVAARRGSAPAPVALQVLPGPALAEDTRARREGGRRGETGRPGLQGSRRQ